MWLFNSGAELLILFILINLNLSNMWLMATLLDSRVKCGMSLALTFFITRRSEILHHFPNQRNLWKQTKVNK